MLSAGMQYYVHLPNLSDHCSVGFFIDSYDLFIINLVSPIWEYEYVKVLLSILILTVKDTGVVLPTLLLAVPTLSYFVVPSMHPQTLVTLSVSSCLVSWVILLVANSSTARK